MRWLRRVLVVALGVVVLVTLLGAGWVGAVNLENSRDESAFIENLDHSVRALRPDYRSFVVGEAWHELCGDALELHEPHNPFNRPAETD